MNYKALAEQFWAQGYVMLEGFFDESLMDAYDELIVDHFGSEPEYLHNEEFLEKAATDVIPWFPQQEGVAAFDVVENDKRLQILTEAILYLLDLVGKIEYFSSQILKNKQANVK